MSGGIRECSVCGRTLENTPFPNKSAICRLCRRRWEKENPDRFWDEKRKCWLLRDFTEIDECEANMMRLICNEVR